MTDDVMPLPIRPIPEGDAGGYSRGMFEPVTHVTPYMPSEAPDGYLNTSDAAYYIGTGTKQVRDLLHRGDLLGVPVLTGLDDVPIRYVIHPQSVADFIAWRAERRERNDW